VIDRDDFRPLTSVEVQLAQVLEHVERLVVVLRVALEELERALRATDLRVRHHEFLARLTHEVLDVCRLGVLRAELDRLHEALERALEVLEVVEAPRLLVDRVAVDLVALRRDLRDLLVELLGGLHVALLEVVLRERQIRVRDVHALREVLDQPVIDLARAIELLHLVEREAEREEHLVHLLVVGVIFHQERERLDVVFTRARERLLGVVLRLLQRVALALVLLDLAGLVDGLVHLAHVGRRDLRELEVTFRETQQEVGAPRVVRARVLDQALRDLELAQE